jgi:peptidoglycan/LPS O-acetylase OafA/YrhL
MTAVPIRPIYFAMSIALLGVAADLLRRIVPFYRQELKVEAATRLTPLDGLRGLLCFGVMYHHAAITQGFLASGVWTLPPSAFCLLLGQSSVAMFFCITGFLFWSRAIAHQGNLPVWSFWRGRWFRIVPLYLFTCAVVLWIARKQIHWHQHATHLGLGRMALMGLNAWGPLYNFDPNLINAGVVWSLQFEWVFYLALPAIAPMVRDGGGWKILLVFAGLKSLQGWMNPPDMTFFFLTGILAAHVARLPHVTAILRRSVVSIFITGIAIAMPFLLDQGYGWLPLLLTTLIFVPIACGNSLLGVLNWSGFRMMGVVSYSVYLLHGIFLYESRGWLKAHVHTNTQYWFAILGLACIVLIGCSVTYRLIEWPAIQFEKRLRRSAKTVRKMLPEHPPLAASRINTL